MYIYFSLLASALPERNDWSALMRMYYMSAETIRQSFLPMPFTLWIVLLHLQTTRFVFAVCLFSSTPNIFAFLIPGQSLCVITGG